MTFNLFGRKPKLQGLDELVKLPAEGSIFDLNSGNLSLFEKELLSLFEIYSPGPESDLSEILSPRLMDVYRSPDSSGSENRSNHYKSDSKLILTGLRRYDNQKGFNLQFTKLPDLESHNIEIYMETLPRFAFLEPVRRVEGEMINGGLYLSSAKDTRYPFSRRKEEICVVNGYVSREIRQQIKLQRLLEKERSKAEAQK